MAFLDVSEIRPYLWMVGGLEISSSVSPRRGFGVLGRLGDTSLLIDAWVEFTDVLQIRPYCGKSIHVCTLPGPIFRPIFSSLGKEGRKFGFFSVRLLQFCSWYDINRV